VSVSVFNLVSKLFNVPLLNITTSFVADVNICITKLVRHFSLLHMMNSIDFLKEKILIFNKKVKDSLFRYYCARKCNNRCRNLVLQRVDWSISKCCEPMDLLVMKSRSNKNHNS
jgi:hypothetical protein